MRPLVIRFSKIETRKLLAFVGGGLGFLMIMLAPFVHSIPFAFWKIGSSPSSFIISGVTGGADNTPDEWLGSGANPVIHFVPLSGATAYDVIVKDSAGVVTLCSALNQVTSPTSPSSCGLSNGGTYKVYVTAKPSNISAMCFLEGDTIHRRIPGL